MITKYKIKKMNIRGYKKMQLLDALRAKRVTFSFKVALHSLSILSTAVYMQGVIASSAKAVFANYEFVIENMKALMVTSLSLATAGATILELATVEAGSKVGALIREYFDAKKEYDITPSKTNAWRLKSVKNKIMFFIPIALIIIALQVYTFSSGAVNTAKLFKPPVSVESAMMQNEKDIEFATSRIQRARERIAEVESKGFTVTKEDLGEYSKEEEIRKIDEMYASQLSHAIAAVDKAKAKYDAYLRRENAKASNFNRNGTLRASARRIYEAKKAEILSPALSRLRAIKDIIAASKANVKSSMTKGEYINHVLENQNKIIEIETKNLETYKKERMELEASVENRKKAIDNSIDMQKFLLAGAVLVLFQILFEIWYKFERDTFAELISVNMRNSQRNNTARKYSEELEMPVPDFIASPKQPEEGVETHKQPEEGVASQKQSEDDNPIEDLKNDFPELFKMCIENLKAGRGVPTKNDMIGHVLSASVVNRFRRRANGVLYTVDRTNGNTTEWSNAVKEYISEVA